MKRRSIIETSATLGLGALAGCALPTSAQGPKTPFAVAGVTVPIVGSDMLYPVRRIYCIGRNYAGPFGKSDRALALAILALLLASGLGIGAIAPYVFPLLALLSLFTIVNRARAGLRPAA
jgi:hypothetical protein